MKYKVFFSLLASVLLIVGILLVLHHPHSSTSAPKPKTKTSSASISDVLAPSAIVKGASQNISIGGDSEQPEVVYTMTVGCADCIGMAKELNSIAAEYESKGVKFYGVDIEGTDSVKVVDYWINAITSPNHITYTVDAYSNFLQEYKVTQLSELYILYKGKIMYQAQSPSTKDVQLALSRIV